MVTMKTVSRIPGYRAPNPGTPSFPLQCQSCQAPSLLSLKDESMSPNSPFAIKGYNPSILPQFHRFFFSPSLLPITIYTPPSPRPSLPVPIKRPGRLKERIDLHPYLMQFESEIIRHLSIRISMARAD